MPFSILVKVNNKTIQIRCKGFLSSFDFLPEVCLWFRFWQYHYSKKPTVKCTCITLYSYTVHCTMMKEAVGRQHENRTSKKSEMMTYKDTTEEICEFHCSEVDHLAG